MNRRILIFDDDQGILNIMKYILEDKGLEVINSPHCRDVVSQIKNADPSIIMMDNNIPDCGGVVAIQTIKQNAEFKNIPIIFFTANPDVESLAKEAGADSWLAKPFELDALYDAIENILHGNADTALMT